MKKEDLQRVVINGRECIGGASFRGVTFLVVDTETSGGRRGDVSQFADGGVDSHYVNDTGAQAGSISISGYLSGPDALKESMALEEALWADGTAELVHPFYPRAKTASAWVPSFRFRRSTASMGWVEFSAEFVLSPQNKPTASTVAPDAVVREQIAEAVTIEAERFESTFAPPTEEFQIDIMSKSIGTVTDSINALAERCTSAALVAEIQGEADAIFTNAGQLLTTPAALFESARAQFMDPTLLVTSFLDLMRDTYEPIFAMFIAPMPADTPQERALLDSNVSLKTSMRRLALLRGLQDASFAIDYTTANEAQTTVEQVREAIDREILESSGDSTSDDFLSLLGGLKTSVATAILDRAGAESRIVEVNFPKTSILLAWEEYGDPFRSVEICERNQVPHPAAIVGTMELLA